MSALSIRQVAKSFGSTKVLNDVSLAVESGEFVVLLGASGSGKSTLLRIIAGLERADHGSIDIGGEDVTGLPPNARDLAMVFQNYALYPQMSVARNVGLGLEMRRLSPWQRLPGMSLLPSTRAVRAAIAQDVHEAATTVGIEALLGRRPAQLSGGQRQRVALARAMVRRPRLLLMDEPLSNLDAKLRQRMRGEISDLHRATGATIVYVTHDQIEAMTMATRVAVMVDGEIVQVGSPQSLYADPVDLSVAEMLGSPAINLIEGIVVPGGVDVAGQHWRCTESQSAALATGSRVRIGFRAEQGRLVQGQDLPKAKVQRIEHLGAERLVHLGFPDGSGAVVRLTDETPLAPQDICSVAVDPGKMMLFDENGIRIGGTAP